MWEAAQSGDCEFLGLLVRMRIISMAPHFDNVIHVASENRRPGLAQEIRVARHDREVVSRWSRELSPEGGSIHLKPVITALACGA